jgi:hypothetical protein
MLLSISKSKRVDNRTDTTFPLCLRIKHLMRTMNLPAIKIIRCDITNSVRDSVVSVQKKIIQP